MTIIEGIAERIGAIGYAGLPPEAVRSAKMAVLDTVGVTLAGANEECARIVGRVLGGGAGECLIFGSERRAAPLDAALINGTAAHALDFDDVSDSLGGHPSAPILPALFALGEVLDCPERPVGGRDFIAAYVAGFETETRIGRGVHLHHYEKGWHPTATLGVFGAAAACAHLMGLDRVQTAQALAIAASLAAGIKANFGTMTKPLHVGHTARSGLLAAMLAKEGFTANPAALEHKQGFLQVFNGAGTFDAGKILKDWGQPYDIVRPGLAAKQHPCCGSTHPAIDAMLLLRAENSLGHDIAPDKVARIDSWTHPRRLAHTDRPDPQSGLDAKFSVQYCLARALLEGIIRLDHFEGEAFRDPAVRALMRRIHAAPHPEDGEALGAEVRVTFDDGRVIAQRVGVALGRGPDNPLTPEALGAKFADCAGRALPPVQVAEVQRLLLQLDEAASLRAVVAAIAA